MIKLSLAQPEHTIHIPTAGTYRLHLAGGFSVRGLEDFGIQITQSDTTKVILTEPIAFKQRTRINGKRGVACFQIQFPKENTV